MAYLMEQTSEPTCPNEDCPNRIIGISQKKGHYHSFGETKAGSPRYRCQACGKTFSIGNGKPAIRQRLPHKNTEVFSMVVNAVPMRRICKIAGISQKTLYDKTHYLHRQAMAFVAYRERKLLNGEVPLEKLYLSVDRQEHLINWTNRKDKRQTMFQAIGTADNETSYVFGIHLNYDPGWDREEVEVKVGACRDYEAQPPFRRFARFWLQGDYDPAIALRALEEEKTEHLQGNIGLRGEILKTYEHALARQDVETSDLPADYTKLPLRGLQVHAEYTLYGHFFFLRELLSHVPKSASSWIKSQEFVQPASPLSRTRFWIEPVMPSTSGSIKA